MVNFKQKKAGVIGFGHVGKQVASLLKSIGFKVLIYDPFIDNNSFIRRGESKNNGDRIYNLTRSNNSKRIDSIEDEYIFVSNIDDILDCSFISIHCSLTKSSESLIDKDFISKLKSGTFLINASRGEVINESDLINYGEHINYCLDVWINEPKISKKLVASSIFATPHIAGHSKYAKLNGLDMVYKKLIEWMKKSIVNKYLLGENNISFRNKLNDLEKINDGTMGKIITLKQMDLLLKEGVNLDLYNNEHILSNLFQELRA